MKHVSLFSGIGGFDLGFHKAGIKTILQVENDKFCQKVLTRHWPDIPLIEDVGDVIGEDLLEADILTAGFPCQNLSIAGKREGLKGKRSGLFWEIFRTLRERQVPWIVLENVPGLLSSNKGRDFYIVIKALEELGYHTSWRVLDSRWFGVAQRRRRVFIVGHPQEGRSRAVSFESEGVSRDLEKGSKKRTGNSSYFNGFFGHDSRRFEPVARHRATGSNSQRYDYETETIIPDGLGVRRNRENCTEYMEVQSEAENNFVSFRTGLGAGGSVVSGQILPDISSPGQAQGWETGVVSTPVVYTIQEAGRAHQDRHQGGTGLGLSNGPSYTLGSSSQHGVCAPSFDSHRMRDTSRISKGVDTDRTGEPDGPRYRALGNAVSVPVAHWLARRILKVEESFDFAKWQIYDECKRCGNSDHSCECGVPKYEKYYKLLYG